MVKNTRLAANTAVAMANHLIHRESFMRKHKPQTLCCQNHTTAIADNLKGRGWSLAVAFSE
jgi:hypothetical protein